MKITEYEKKMLVESIDSEVDLWEELRGNSVKYKKIAQLKRLRKRLIKAETKKWWEFWL